MKTAWVLIAVAINAISVATAAGADRPAGSSTERPEIVVTARPDTFDRAARVPDRQLGAMRGGMRLPNGFEVAIGIDIQTRVDGILVLHTIYASDGPIMGVKVYTDGTDGERYAPGTIVVMAPNSPAPIIVTTRSPSGTTIAPGSSSGASTVNLVNGPETTWVTADGQNEVPVTVDGGPVTTGPGTFSLRSASNGVTSELDTADLQIRHLIGQATGVVIANAGSNRAIDTVSSVNIDLQNVAPLVATSIFSNQALALDIVRGR